MFIFVCLLGLDALTKVAALQYIPPLAAKLTGFPFGGIPIFDWTPITFSLNLVGNSGAACGLFQGHSGILFAFRSVIIACLIVYLLFFNRGKNPSFPLWLIVIGAVGNAIDYWVYGHVTDFFHFCFWGRSFPIFNLADTYISIGVIVLFFFSRVSKLRTASL
jgi:signal peptidase II